MNGGTPEKQHECSQAITLNSICLQLTEIKESVKRIDEKQETLISSVQLSQIERAKYPTPDKVADIIAMVGRHETYFMIGGTLLAFLIVGMIDLALKVF